MPPLIVPKVTCRDHLLDSAEEVILRSGIGSLTLDAVAAYAKVSKGGLLYHFPSKDALILALVQRTCDNWRKDYTEAIEAAPPGPGRVARALLDMCMGSTESCSETCRRSSVVLVAAMVNNPALAAPLRRTHDDLRARLRADGGSVAAAAAGEAVVLAMNGMWFEQIFGLQEMSAARLSSIRAALEALVRSAVEPEKRTKTPVKRGSTPRASGTRTRNKRGAKS